MKLIEVRYGHKETHHNDDGYTDYSYSYIEYDSIAFFDNVEDAWKLIQYRIEKYHTRLSDYSINLVEINPQPSTCLKTNAEEYVLEQYNRDIEWEQKCELNKNTIGFKCSECNAIIKTNNASLEESVKNNHAITHTKDNCWSHVIFERIMKKDDVKND